MLRRSALAAGALIGAFHVWLLGHQLWSGQLAQPDVVLRWLVALALVAGLAALGRRSVPVVFSRQGVAVWLLAALLHGPALANDQDGFATPALPEAVVTVAQSAAALGAIALALLAVALMAWAAPAAIGLALVPAPTSAGPLAALRTSGYLPRPPPRT